jgi:YD repeat-containing protein
VSLTNYTYDEAQYLTGTSGVLNHGTPPSSRGNATTVSRWVSGSTYITAHTNFYDTGVPFNTIDPNTSSTQYAYMCQSAYPNTITAPASLTTTLNWDCNTGLLTSATDPNGQPTTYHYDSEGRTTEIDFADGGQLNSAYDLSSTPPNIVNTTKVDSTHNRISTTLLDGLGRVFQTQINSDGAGIDYVDIVYDSVGRVQSRSNPYRTTSDPTYGLTSYAYDALGRVTQITNPDNQTVLYSFTARANSVQDEGNGSTRVQRVYQRDGLERLTSVCEVSATTLVGTNGTPSPCGQDIAATGFLTSYQYDALGDVTRIVQSGLNDRVMVYDGLSRMTSETVPEIADATLTYIYNSGGDLYQRIRPTVNQNNPAVTTTTTYSYDALHRLTQLQYSDGTPGASYYYDEASVSGLNLTNYKGRLTHSYKTVGSTCTSNILSYDPLGRITSEWQQAPYLCGTSRDQIAYQYNVAGDMISLTNGRGVTFTLSYDAISSFTSMTSSANDAQHPGTLISGLQYNPLGEVTAANLGNGLTLSRSYNKEGWITGAT